MSPASRDLEKIILEKNPFAEVVTRVLLMYASNAVIDRDPAGNRKLQRKKIDKQRWQGWWL